MEFDLLKGFDADPSALGEFAEILEQKTFASREVIAADSEKASEMFFVLEGRVSINKMSEKGEIVPIARLDGRDRPFFGEAAILGVGSRSANAVADTQCKCLILRKEQFDAFAEVHPLAALNFFKKLAVGLFAR